MAENSLNDEIAKALNSSIGDENPVIQEEPNNEYDIMNIGLAIEKIK